MRKKKVYFGLSTAEEKVYFERWRLPIIVLETDAATHKTLQNVDSSALAYPPGL